MGSFREHWAEYFAVLFLILAFAIIVFVNDAKAAFFIIFLGGIAAGRVFHESKNKGMFPFFLITLGPWIGFMFGSNFFGWKIVSLIYFAAYYASYKMHTLGIIP